LGKVPVVGAVFIGSVDRSGRGVLYDVQCDYRLYGLAYANDDVERNFLARLSEGNPSNAPRPKFFLWARGQVSFQPGYNYVFRLDEFTAVASISDSDVPRIIAELKATKRLVSDATGF
jgi:hypothetical protein